MKLTIRFLLLAECLIHPAQLVVNRSVVIPDKRSLEFGLRFPVIVELGIAGTHVAMKIRVSRVDCQCAVQIQNGLLWLMFEKIGVAQIMTCPQVESIET